eukprot:CAMPEP_0184981300 /NCGR_PEP_ID=MMETSP1098-20130426/11082_1 /TAXON_ID=89044 /ORGANISM="Spumella elongata, Strain CCAP 955/1" /LENGTH=609 /DNA_ID=CAMNT_0027504853 /DNA_START=41 /DNA_END=1871 /DNA_ORIENTATION=-
MHIAICVWGIVRSLRFTIESIHNYCLDPITNAGHTYEIYMHTYKFHGVYDNLRSNERGLRLNFSEWQVLRPDHIYVEDQDLFDQSQDFSTFHGLGDPWKNEFVSFQNHLRAMNSLYYLATQVERDSQHKHFDGIVYLRPDVTYLNELPFHLLEHLPNTLFVPDFHRSCRGGEYNDRMAMGDLKTGLIYGKKIPTALAYSQRKQLHSEKFIYDYLRSENVTVKEIPFRFRRTRANGEFHVRDSTAIVAPRNQKPHPTYRTHFVLRMVYNFLEEITNHQVYVWNHDDHENLYCKPHAYLTIEDVLHYRKLSRRMRFEREKHQHLRIKSNTKELNPEDAMGKEEILPESTGNVESSGRIIQWGELLNFVGGGAYIQPPLPKKTDNPMAAVESNTPTTIVTPIDASVNTNTATNDNSIHTTTSNEIHTPVRDFANTVYRTFYTNPDTAETTNALSKKEQITKQKRLNKQERRRRKKNPAPEVVSPYQQISEFLHLHAGPESPSNGDAAENGGELAQNSEAERMEHGAENNERQSPYYRASKAQVTRAARKNPIHTTTTRSNQPLTRVGPSSSTGRVGGVEGRETPLTGFNLRGMASRELESRQARKNKARAAV